MSRALNYNRDFLDAHRKEIPLFSLHRPRFAFLMESAG
jgi:hypothetical protein